ncbi:MAG TPA: hypothetical protein VL282_08585 [Tepidisphaeraceae bacterium]|jgi:hypothetical protein|nr:hypothetical protein [Tepidisphaeraceae bacterium]
MVTVKQIEKLWKAESHGRLFRELVANRPEASVRLEAELPASPVSAAAMAMIRLDELSQSHVPFHQKLLHHVLSRQEADGGWGDPMATALCMRALLAGRGHGQSIDRGLLYLANLQKSEGIWPKVPIRRMESDPFVSAFILYQLGASGQFRSAVRFFDALNWFESNEPRLDAETRRLWDHASIRCQIERTLARVQPNIWS